MTSLIFVYLTSNKCWRQQKLKNTYVFFLIFWKPKWWFKFVFVACLYQILQRFYKAPKSTVQIGSKTSILEYNSSLWRFKQTYFSRKRNEFNEWVYFSINWMIHKVYGSNIKNHEVKVWYAQWKTYAVNQLKLLNAKTFLYKLFKHQMNL